MGPNGGTQSRGGRGVGFEGVQPGPAIAEVKQAGARPDYEGIDQGVLGELKFKDFGGKGSRPDTSGSGGNDDKPTRGGID